MHGQTLLMHAVGNAWLEGAEILIENGARIDEVTNDSWTAFFHSVSRGYVEITLLLIENGASMIVRNNMRHAPLESAINAKGIEVMKTIFLFEHFK